MANAARQSFPGHITQRNRGDAHLASEVDAASLLRLEPRADASAALVLDRTVKASHRQGSTGEQRQSCPEARSQPLVCLPMHSAQPCTDGFYRLGAAS
jgi:hypothetical protein